MKSLTIDRTHVIEVSQSQRGKGIVGPRGISQRTSLPSVFPVRMPLFPPPRMEIHLSDNRQEPAHTGTSLFCRFVCARERQRERESESVHSESNYRSAFEGSCPVSVALSFTEESIRESFPSVISGQTIESINVSTKWEFFLAVQ